MSSSNELSTLPFFQGIRPLDIMTWESFVNSKRHHVSFSPPNEKLPPLDNLGRESIQSSQAYIRQARNSEEDAEATAQAFYEGNKFIFQFDLRPIPRRLIATNTMTMPPLVNFPHLRHITIEINFRHDLADFEGGRGRLFDLATLATNLKYIEFHCWFPFRSVTDHLINHWQTLGIPQFATTSKIVFFGPFAERMGGRPSREQTALAALVHAEIID